MKSYLAHSFTMNAAALVVILAVGCSKSPGGSTAQETKLRQAFLIPADLPMTNLGVVELSTGTPKRLSLGAGKDCVVTTTELTNGLLQMDLAFTSKSVDGHTTDTYKETGRFIERPNQECAVMVGHMAVALTPTLKAQ